MCRSILLRTNPPFFCEVLRPNPARLWLWLFLSLSGSAWYVPYRTKPWLAGSRLVSLPSNLLPLAGLGERFFYFLFSFFTEIYFRFRNLQEYIPAAPLPSDRDLVAPLRGGRGFCAKTFAKIFVRRSLGPVARPAGPPSRPAAGRPALAARLQGDRLSHPYIRVGWSPHPSFASLKFQKPRKKERGRERGEALPDF